MDKVMVCKDCGSDEVTYDTSVRWDVGAQKWQTCNDMWAPWCNDCDVKAEIVAIDDTSVRDLKEMRAKQAK
jgi:hypothetical protein